MLRSGTRIDHRRLKNVSLAGPLILPGTADRSAARIPSRQALRRWAAEAAVPVAQPEAAAGAEVVPVAQPEVAAGVEVVPVAQQEVVAGEAAVPASQQEVVAAEAVVPVAQPEVAAGVEVVPVAQQEVVAVEAAVPASQPEVVATEAAAPASQLEVVAAEAVVPVAQPEVAAGAEVVPVAQQEVVAAEAAVPASQQEVVAAEAAVPASQQEVVAAEAEVPASQQEVAPSVSAAQQEAASPVAPREELVLVWPAALEPPVVLTKVAVQAAPSVPARAPAVAGSETGSARCRETAAAAASAPQSLAKPAAVAARCRWGLAMDLGRPSSRPVRPRLALAKWSAAAVAAADLQWHRAAAVPIACPGWASPLQPERQQQAAMPALPASARARSQAESETARVSLAWRLQAKDLLLQGLACRWQSAKPPEALLVACG
jgi:ribonuclease E